MTKLNAMHLPHLPGHALKCYLYLCAGLAVPTYTILGVSKLLWRYARARCRLLWLRLQLLSRP